ncbi:MAG: site-specific integrase [Lachnospiraceae bacterium]|nr:site-specific integrase [Lachnospiraceae bacterium]
MIDISYVQEKIEMSKRSELLAEHPYKIWEGKDGKWYTYLPDETRGRILKKRSTKKDIENLVVQHWKNEKENPQIKEIYEEWTQDKLNREEISYATKNRYDRQFNESMIEFGKLRIKQVQPHEIEDFILDSIHKHSLTQKGYSNLRTLIYGIFKRAKKRGFISYSITELIDDMEIPRKLFRKHQKSDDELVFMQDERPKVINYLMSKRDIINLGILLLFKTGLRPGELTALKWEDINQNIIHVCRTEIRYRIDNKDIYEVRNFPKTEAGIRDVIIPINSVWILKEIRLLNPFGQYMFEEKGKRIRTYRFSQRMETVCKHTGVTLKSLNKIRKTYSSILIDEKVSESIIISQMGHTKIDTTKNFYYKNRKNIAQKADVINRVEGL